MTATPMWSPQFGSKEFNTCSGTHILCRLSGFWVTSLEDLVTIKVACLIMCLIGIHCLGNIEKDTERIWGAAIVELGLLLPTATSATSQQACARCLLHPP